MAATVDIAGLPVGVPIVGTDADFQGTSPTIGGVGLDREVLLTITAGITTALFAIMVDITTALAITVVLDTTAIVDITAAVDIIAVGITGRLGSPADIISSITVDSVITDFITVDAAVAVRSLLAAIITVALGQASNITLGHPMAAGMR